MTGTLNVTIDDAALNDMPDTLIRVYDLFGGLAAAPQRSTTGARAFVVAAGSYRIHVDPVSAKYLPQWWGGGDANTAAVAVVTESGTTNVTVQLAMPTTRAEVQEAEDRAQPLFWKDTSAGGALLVLYPGEERRAFTDPFSSYYHHVLLGPFTTSAAAA